MSPSTAGVCGGVCVREREGVCVCVCVCVFVSSICINNDCCHYMCVCFIQVCVNFVHVSVSVILSLFNTRGNYPEYSQSVNHHPPLTPSHPHTITPSQAEILGALKKALIDIRPKTFDGCIQWARNIFEDYFHNTIAQLLFNFPPDHVSPYSGSCDVM